MNRRELFAGVGAAAFVTGLTGETWADVVVPPQPTVDPGVLTPPVRQTLLLNDGWRFYEGDFPLPPLVGPDVAYATTKAGAARGAASPGFDDSEWQNVRLPHDFASFQPISEADFANGDQGFRRRGVGWYRTSLKFSEADRGKHIELQIEGASSFATVWFNGTLVDRNWSGYSSAYVDLTPYITYGDSYNSLVIRVDATTMEGWWYEGAGLYRDVWIVKRDPVHIVTDGVYAHPVKDADGDGWTIPVEVTLNNSGKADSRVHIESRLFDRERAGALSGAIATATAAAEVASLGSSLARLELKTTQPRLWSVETPGLYHVVTRIFVNDRQVDEVTTTCGFRTQHFDPNTGFHLNGKYTKIKGVCMHQDHAGVGLAVPEGLMDFRLRRLKSLGCNAIRFSHNAQDRKLMDACDRHGFLVMAENRQFNPSPDYLAQLEWLVRRDRNHPSVILWSVFNEEPMQGTEAGYEMVRRMSAAVKTLDTTRPVTAAMNDGLFTPLNVAHAVDVVGINYQQHQYDPFHAAWPDKPMMSSEDTSAYMTRGEYVTDEKKQTAGSYDDFPAPWGATHRNAWKAIAARQFVAGGFVWTGFDYHGEPKPYLTFPANSSYFGIVDLCGFEKAATHMHRASWIDDKPYVGLVPHHWNWQKDEQVHVIGCANTEEIELFVNGKSAGRQKGNRIDMNDWHVAFAPGRIEARGYNGGKVVATAVVETIGAPVALRLTPDRKTMAGDGRDAQPITIEAVDAKGRTAPFASHMVTFAIDNADIIGLGNGDPTSTEPEKGDKRSLFHGLAQVIVQSRAGKSEAILLRASAPGLKAAELLVPTQWASAPPAQVTGPSVQTLSNWFASPVSAARIDPAAPRDKTWQWFRAGGELPKAPASAGYILTESSLTPFTKVQKAGGTLDFLGITGACEVFIDGIPAGSKTGAAPGILSVPIPPKSGARRITVLFPVTTDTPYGFNGLVRARA